MKHILYALAFGLFLLAFPRVSQAALCPVAFTFTTGLTLTQTNLNANPTAFSNCFANIDYSNIGSAGIYALDLIPTNSSQATFGGSQTYIFPVGVTATGTVVAGAGGSGEYWQTENGYSMHQYLDTSDILHWFNANTSTTVPVNINLSTGLLSTDGISDTDHITTTGTVTSGSSSSSNSLDAYSIGCTTLNLFSNNSFTVAGIGATGIGLYCQGHATNIVNFDQSGNQGIAGTYYGSGATLTGPLSATTISGSGAVSGSSFSTTGGVSAASVTATGTVSGATVTSSGAVNGASASISGTETAGTLVSNGEVEAGSTGNGEYYQTENGYSMHQYIDGSDNLGWYDATTSANSGVFLNLNTGAFTAKSILASVGPIQETVSSQNYTVPYDADSTGGSTNTHLEHWSDSYGSITQGTCSTNQWNFSKSFTSAPGVTANAEFIPTGGDSTSVIVTSITSTYAYIAVCNNSVAARTITVVAIAQGE
jgi:hypothetical protein